MPGVQPGVRRPGYALLVAIKIFCIYLKLHGKAYVNANAE